MKNSSLKTFSINAHMRLITNAYIIIIHHYSCNKIQCEYHTFVPQYHGAVSVTTVNPW